MKTEIFTLCESATELGGKAVIVGTINDVSGVSYPLNIPSLSLFVRIAFEPDETVDTTLNVIAYNQEDPDLVIARFEFPMKVAVGTQMKYINLLLKLDGIHIPKKGVYRFELKTPEWSDHIVLYANQVDK